MTFYIQDAEEHIVFFDDDYERLKGTLAFTDYTEADIRETDRPIVDYEFADTEVWRAKEAEKARLAKIEELEAYLAETDWYVIRFADTGEAIPEEIKTKRRDARDEISRLR